MTIQDSNNAADPLAHRLGAEASAEQIADAMVTIWQEIDTALTPIIGKRGVVALYKRSLFLLKPTDPWLAEMHEGVQKDIDLPTLKSVVVQQDRATAAIGGAAFLRTFHELLATLVGLSLTERLLRSVWPPSSAPLAQDSSP